MLHALNHRVVCLAAGIRLTTLRKFVNIRDTHLPNRIIGIISVNQTQVIGIDAKRIPLDDSAHLLCFIFRQRKVFPQFLHVPNALVQNILPVCFHITIRSFLL